MAPVLVDAARNRVLRHLRSRERELLVDEFSGYGFPLHPPTATKAAADPQGTGEFIRQWEGQPGVEFAVRNWSGAGLGRQRVPVRLQLDTIGAAVEFAGWNEQWRALIRRRDLLLDVVAPDEQKPGADRLAAVVSALPHWRDVPLGDLQLAGEVVDWFRSHPHSGLLPRAVAVEGVHGKWLENHRPLVESLLAARRGETGRAELGLAAPEIRVRLRFHPSDAPAGLSDVEVPLSDLAALPTSRVVFMVENLESFLALPTRPGVVLAWGAGYRAVEIVRTSYFHARPLLYWGDLDADGYAILDGVRSVASGVRSVLMDRPTVERWRHLGVSDRDFTVREYPRLTDAETAGLEGLITAGHLRIEQERIRFDVAVAEVDAAIEGVLGGA